MINSNLYFFINLMLHMIFMPVYRISYFISSLALYYLIYFRIHNILFFNLIVRLSSIFYIFIIFKAAFSQHYISKQNPYRLQFRIVVGIIILILIYNMITEKNVQYYPIVSVIYIACMSDIIVYILISIISIFPKKKEYAYIMVLGCRLKNNKPSSLLISRLNKALKLGCIKSKFILIGGKAHGEEISEAEGMYQYMIERGISKENMILETCSQNTKENFMYAKKLIASGTDNKKIVFVTSDYHVFRAKMLAYQVGLDIKGVGTSTSLLYKIKAMLHEYITVMIINEKQYMKFLMLFSLLSFTIYNLINIF